MYKVFYNNNLIIIGEMPKDSRKTPDKKIVKDRKELFKFLDEVMNQPFKNDIWITGYIAIELFADFKSWFTNVEAAGGIVKNSEGKFLFIKRWDIWDLPKGKIETNESPEMAAIREIREETGIGKLEIMKKLQDTYHIYQVDKRAYLKCTHWYLMSTKSIDMPEPQSDEGIENAVWCNSEQSRSKLSGSYRSLKETFMSVFE